MGNLDRRDFLRAGPGALGVAALAAPAARTAGRPAGGGPPLDLLRRRMHGPLLVPGDPGYDAATAPANGRYNATRPLAVALCAGEHDVVACVDWARQFGVPPVARNGGHSYAGYSTTTGLLIDVGALNSVSIDASAGTAAVGGGALNGDLFRRTLGGPLFLPVGTCLGVGVGGLTLGGGIGYNTHSAGLTCDHLTASRIVTASGDLLDLDGSRHGDLFWACRGGAGGSFGINTSFTFDLVPVPRDPVTYFRFDYRGADAAVDVLANFHDILKTAPPALNAVAMAQAAPVGRGGPREAIDVFSRGQYIGRAAELRDIVGPLMMAGGRPPVMQVITELPFWNAQKIFASTEPASHSFGDISRYAAGAVPHGAVQQMVDLLAACPSRSAEANGAIWSLGWIGGEVVNALRRTQTAYVHRNMLTMLRPTPVWPNDAPPSVGRGLVEWTSEVVRVIDPYTPNESYQNFPNRLISDWREAYYGENFPRLVSVKTTYDRHDLFRNQQSIPPAG